MRVMVIIKANAVSEAGVLPGEKMLTEMGKFNEELVKAGVMLAGEGLHPSSKGKRVRFEGTLSAKTTKLLKFTVNPLTKTLSVSLLR